MNCFLCEPKMSSNNKETAGGPGVNTEMEATVATLKKERGAAKGAITRWITCLERINKTQENVPKIKEKLGALPGVVKLFEDAHQHYVAVLSEETDKDEAVVYRQNVLSEVENLEQEIYMWLAEELGDEEEEAASANNLEEENTYNCDQPLVTPDLVALEEEYKKTVQMLADIRKARDLEDKIFKMRLEAQKATHDLQQEKQHNELRLQKDKHTGLGEHNHLEEELMRSPIEASEARGVGPTLNYPFTSTPGHTDGERPMPNRSNPQQLYTKPARVSSDEDEQVKFVRTLISGVLNESRVQQQGLVDSLQLPRRELRTFDGDPLHYWPFIRSFNTTVDAKNIDSASKLSCLLQHCKGSARKALNCCETMEPEDGYTLALKILKERFGNSYEISQKWIQKIINRSNLKGPTDLRDFSDDLNCCQQTLKNMGHEGELDNAASLQIIWKKLPQYLQDRWTKANHAIKKEEKRIPKLADLVNFIKNEAEEALDPIFTRTFSGLRNSKEGSLKGEARYRAKSFATRTNSGSIDSSSVGKIKQTQGKCPCCGQGHYLTQCSQFKGMKIKDRRSYVMSKGLCLNCFARGHLSKDCPRNFVCTIDGCGLKHNKYLHMLNRLSSNNSDVIAVSTPQVEQSVVSKSSSTAANISSHFVRTCGGKLAMPIVPARVWCSNSDNYIDTYAMLDSGSNATYCSEALCDQLGAQGTMHHLELTTLTQSKMSVDTKIVNLFISNVDGVSDFTCNVEATVRPSLNIDLVGKSTPVDIERWSHLRDLELPEVMADQVHLLIGQDSSDLLLPSDVRKGGSGEPFAVLTPLGWAINGPVNPHGEINHNSYFIKACSPLEGDLKRLWEIEGVYSEEKGWSINDQRAIDTWNETLQVVDNHYCMNIPFKALQPNLPDNKLLAEKRLQSLAKRLNKDETLKGKYIEEISQLVQKGYAEIVPDEDLNRHDGKVWYLPHHPVFNPKKPEKCRIVFDCAAKFKCHSLNDHVHQGPDLTNRLIGVLLRFRQGAIGFMADIEAMFHQVFVTPENRDVLRFLWFENHGTPQQVKTLRMTVHLFGGVWSPSCANYALQQVVEEYHDKYPEEVRNTVLRNFYVDDCLKSVDNVDSAVSLALQVKELLSRRGFHLTKFVSSSPELLKHVPKEDLGKSLIALNLNLDELPNERALGMLWHVNTDCLGFDVQIDQNKSRTKRGVLSTLSGVYDPLGYISPYILMARRIFQEVCRLQKGWDEPLPVELEEQWGRWLEDLHEIMKFKVPRCIKPVGIPVKRAQLHHFADASEYGYGAASYLKVILEDNSVHVNLIKAKSRLAPLKGSTIPRLELAGALEAVRLDKILIEELEIPLDSSVYWVDSEIVLWYLMSPERRFQTYVANRVAKILSHTEIIQWRYVPTEENPGDDTSRGMSATELLKSDRWVRGPEFLQHEEHGWPNQPTFRCLELDKQLELKTATVTYCTSKDKDYVTTLLNYYSSWFKLKTAVVWFSRFKQYLMKKPQLGPISVRELHEAERDIVLYVQREIQEESTQLRKLNPFKTSDGLLKVGGRLTNSQIEEDTKHPVILPYKHQVSRLIVLYCHQITGHSGVERVLAETRKKFWILKGRKLIKGVVYDCIMCKIRRGKTETQQMANLPKSRVTPFEPPFSRVGVDYFGPFMIKRGRSEVKRYGCVFTCLATRAIHIEVSFSLDTDSFIHTLERFIARRGGPKEIWSDNGTNFIGAQKELKKAIQEWNLGKIHAHLLQKEVDWKFNPPAASHMGGIWERMIRTIRSVLTGIIKQQTLDDEALVTLLTVVEGIINNRPITKMSDDPRDAMPLTPNHLLMLRSGPLLPPGQFVEKDCYRRRWKQVQYLADIFWERWLREYLPALQERQKWMKPQTNLKVGDLVIVKQDSCPRNQWPLGLVVGVRKGHDDLVRSVEVRTGTGTYERPVTKICLLESTVAE